MKLLVLAYELPPNGGGTGQALFHLLHHFPILPDWQIAIWTAAPPEGYQLQSLPQQFQVHSLTCDKESLHYWRTSEMMRLLFGLYFNRELRSFHADVVLVWGGWPLGLLLAGPLRRTPSVLALRGSDVPGFNIRTSNAFWRGMARWIWKHAGVVTVNSPRLGELARQTWDHDFPVIPNGVVIPEPCQRTMTTTINLLMVNRLIPRKRVHWMLEALRDLPSEARHRFYLRIAGNGPERGKLERIVSSYDLDTQVEFLGEVPREQLNCHYQQADVFILTSESEGFSNALLEAMSYGLACYSSAQTGFEDIDRVVPSFNSPEELAGMLLNLVHSQDLLSEQGKRARSVVQSYDWRTIASQFIQLIKASIH